MQQQSSLPFLLFVLLVLLCYVGYLAYTLKIPCDTPISYHLASYDERFGLSEEKIKNYVRQAALVWNDEIGKEVLIEGEKKELPIIFVYQELQRTIDSIESINDTIDEAKAEQTRIANEHGDLKKAYEEALRKGKATREMVDELNRLRARYYTLRDIINAEVAEGRALPQGEAEAGLYHSDRSGAQIYIYGFGNEKELLSVLIHEFGHALGLGHVNDRQAVMYASDSNSSVTLNASDKAELLRACSEQKQWFSGILKVLKDRIPSFAAV